MTTQYNKKFSSLIFIAVFELSLVLSFCNLEASVGRNGIFILWKRWSVSVCMYIHTCVYFF